MGTANEEFSHKLFEKIGAVTFSGIITKYKYLGALKSQRRIS
jgi:hypothetical protein